MKLQDKQKLKRWDAFIKGLRRATTIDMDETPQLKELRIERLLNDPVEFFKYYFPHYCSSDFNSSQLEAINVAINNTTIYEVLEWARGHAKSSTIAPMVALYLTFKEGDVNLLMVSYNENNAADLLKPIKLELEKNARIINDFGNQKGVTGWEDKKFVTRNGCSFRAIGSGQSPRGSREEEVRPNIIICDDIDEDEMLRNPRRLDQTWEWVTGALYNCFDIKGKKRFFVINNKIAKDSILTRASKLADFHSVVNAIKRASTKVDKTIIATQLQLLKNLRKKERDIEKLRVIDEAIKYLNDGYIPTWHQRYSMLEIAYIMLKIGTRMFQREYMNNPITDGKIFKREYFQYRKMLKPSQYNSLILTYLDPSFKNKKSSDCKSWVCLGLRNGQYDLLKVFCDRTTTEEMIEWGYSLDDYIINGNGAARHFMEDVFLQDLLYKDFDAVAKKKNRSLSLVGDKRKKPDKDARILAMEGDFQRGNMYFNEDEKDNHHQIRFEDQLTSFEPGVNSLKDGPDALEGARFKLNEMISMSADIGIGKRSTNNKRV